MYDFFILGQIPGTGLIISFSTWALLGALVATIALWAAYRRHRELRTYNIPTISAEPTAQ